MTLLGASPVPTCARRAHVLTYGSLAPPMSRDTDEPKPAPGTPSPRLAGRHYAALAAGLVLYFAGFSLGETMPGIQIAIRPDWTNSTPGELYFWFAFIFFFTPASFLLGYALSPKLAAPMQQAFRRLAALTKEESRAALLLLVIVQFAMARFAYFIVLRTYPATDDEWSARYGGQILTLGKTMVPLPHGYRAMPDLYLFVRHGMVTSFDWIGAQVVWAIGLLTGTDTFLFSVFAALPVAFVAFVAGKRLGFAWGAVAAFLFAISPMGFAISGTTHAHLLSRAFVSMVFALYLVALEKRTLGIWAAIGALVGLSVLCRPFETTFTLMPLFIDQAWQARKDKDARRALLGTTLGIAIPVILWMLHMKSVTGSPFLPARFAHNEISPFGAGKTRPPFATFTNFDVFWNRFGKNFSYNAFMLLIWAGGPIVSVFAVFGAFRDRFARVLGVCVLSGLSLALIHDNPGIHTVGPVHYTEALVAIVLLATFGIERAWRGLGEHMLARTWMPASLCLGLALSLGTFNYWNGRALRQQALIHEVTYSLFETPELANKVVLAPRYAAIWNQFYFAREIGSFVFMWRPASPLKDESVVIVYDIPGTLSDLKKDYPNREFVRFQFTTPPSYEFVPVDTSPAALAADAARIQGQNAPR